MNEHGILFLKQKNVGKAYRGDYTAMTRRFSVIFALVCFLMGPPLLSTFIIFLPGRKPVPPTQENDRCELPT